MNQETNTSSMFAKLSLLTFLFSLVSLIGISDTWAQGAENFVLESHVGARPRDADSLLAPLLDELQRNQFPGSSVAGSRIHSRHSITSAELSTKQIEKARRAIKDGHLAFINTRFEGAVDFCSKGMRILLSRPATMAKQQQVRELLYDGLIVISMAHGRLGNKQALDQSMGEYIRSFPDKEVSMKKFGPEAIELYQRINRKIKKQGQGELQIVASAGSMIFINERYEGLGSLRKQLYPGRYRIFTQNGQNSGRVHLVDVEEDRNSMLVVDALMDKSLRTTKGFTGLVFHDQEERSREENRLTLEIGRAVSADSIILVGFLKVKGRDSVVASHFSIEKGLIGRSGSVSFPDNGSPSAKDLRDLAQYVIGEKPASDAIVILDPVQVAEKKQESPKAQDVEHSETASATTKVPQKGAGISPAWRWASWTAGLVGVGVGSYLIKIDGEGNCKTSATMVSCPDRFETIKPGIASLSGGLALGLLGFYLWTLEGDEPNASLGLLPTQGGWSVALSGRF